MKTEKAPGLAVLIGHAEPHDGAEREDKGDDARDAMDAFIAAVHAKDVDGALQAFGALHDMHAADDGEEPEGADEE